MDRKSIITLVVSIILIYVWMKTADKILPTPPRPATNAVTSATNQLAETNQTTTASTTDTGKTPEVTPHAQEELLSVTNQSAIYVFTTHGGGLKRIELLDYRETIECGVKATGDLRPATLNANAPAPVLAVLGGDSIEGDGVYELTKTETGVRAVKQLANGLRIEKDFDLQTNHLFKAKVRLENTSTAPVKVPQQEIVVGTSTPMNTNDNAMAMGGFWYNGKAQEVKSTWFDNKTLGCIPGTPRTEFVSSRAVTNDVGWAEAHNQFFTMAAISDQPAALVVCRKVALTNAKELYNPAHHVITNGFQTSLAYAETILKEKGVIEHDLTLYVGPKEYRTISKIGADLKNDFDRIMGFGFFGIVSEALLVFLNWLHSIGLNYGVAIILMTVLIKGIFWPLTAASTRSMKRMQALQPKIKALQEKYKDDPTKLSQKQWELWREHKVNPLSGCWPMMIQIPVFFGLLTMLRNVIELRGASFLWACDLSQADTVAIINGFHINPIAIITIITSFWQAHIMPSPQDADPQQKMMKYMPAIFFVFFYNTSSGLTLYWSVQNLLTILQTALTKNTVDDGGKKPTAAPAKKK